MELLDDSVEDLDDGDLEGFDENDPFEGGMDEFDFESLGLDDI